MIICIIFIVLIIVGIYGTYVQFKQKNFKSCFIWAAVATVSLGLVTTITYDNIIKPVFGKRESIYTISDNATTINNKSNLESYTEAQSNLGGTDNSNAQEASILSDISTDVSNIKSFDGKIIKEKQKININIQQVLMELIVLTQI